ncbi:beta-N-acetylhexosaminidase [Myxococcota bacterium]|nr:beta-N-acetylhexosaminidase [Myxococcota bacterium]
MDLGRAAGQVLIGGFYGERIDPAFGTLVESGQVGGVILFARNVGTIEQTAQLLAALRALSAPEPLLYAIDQEGGRVQRLRAPFPEMPPMRLVGDRGRKSLARRAAMLVGERLAMLGFNQSYAPVLDVDSNPANPVIGDRSFSRDPFAVARLGAAYVDGLQSVGVAACGKHFPGHGDTSTDSHLELPRLDHDLARLEAVELVPFVSAVRAGVAAIMTAHIMFPAFDRDHPATLSAHVIDALLRKKLGYDGVIVSDDLEMRAIADHYGIEDAAVRAVRAGCDQLLICHQPDLVRRAHRALVSAVEDGSLPAARLFEAAERVRRMKAAYPLDKVVPPSEVVAKLASPEHARLVALITGEATEALAHDDGVPELELDEGDPNEKLELDT